MFCVWVSSWYTRRIRTLGFVFSTKGHEMTDNLQLSFRTVKPFVCCSVDASFHVTLFWLKHTRGIEYKKQLTETRQLHFEYAFLYLFRLWIYFIFIVMKCTEGKKLKGKGKGGSYSTAALRHIVLLPKMSSFIHLQRRCTHQAAWETSASEGRNYVWNLASNP